MRARAARIARRLLATAVALCVAAGAAAERPIPLEAFFGMPVLARVGLNPSGTLIYEQGFVSGLHVVTIRNTSTAAITTVFSFPGPIDIAWVDDDTLILQAGEQGARRVLIHLERLEYGVVSSERSIEASGWLVDSLPMAPDEVLWADWDGSASRVYRAPVGELVQPSARVRGNPQGVVDRKHEVAELEGQVLYWIPDTAGVPRAALLLESLDPIRIALRYRRDAGSRWREIGSWSAIDPFPIPVGFAPGGHDLLVIGAQGRDTVALSRYLVDRQELGEVIFAHPTADITGVEFDHYGNEVIAVYWEEAGIRHYHYLDGTDPARQGWTDQVGSDKVTHVTSRTANRRLATLLVTGPRDPGQYYVADAQTRQLTALGAVAPWLDPAQMAEVSAIDVHARDGMSIEAFLARPAAFRGDRPPLVVMPHGGPIGVQDSRDFNPVVQALAAQGFAVLQVNYRGSGGRGTGFLEAGLRAWGRGIEDDIEAAIDHVVAAGQVDRDRICIFGGSYGGYSALISITRPPRRYRCAIAMAAPSDLLLLSNDFLGSEDGRKLFTRMVGDPDTDRDHLISISPAYRAADMDAPILLIHGDRDPRVDLEHAYRMRAMLDAHGKAYEWMLLQGGTHDPTPLEWLRIMEAVQRFLAKHLQPAPGADRGDPASAAAARR